MLDIIDHLYGLGYAELEWKFFLKLLYVSIPSLPRFRHKDFLNFSLPAFLGTVTSWNKLAFLRQPLMTSPWANMESTWLEFLVLGSS